MADFFSKAFLDKKLIRIFFSLAKLRIFCICSPWSFESDISMKETFLSDNKVSITECLPSICLRLVLFLE